MTTSQATAIVMGRRAVDYTRISKDDEGEGLGVQRQRDDLRREAARRDLELVRHLEDNDLSGSGKVRRPDFEVLLEMILAGEVDVVLTWDLDRVSRGWVDYVRFYNACEKMGIIVAWLGGQANFATGDGLLELQMRASFAQEELRKIRKRVVRKHKELADKGMDSGGALCFGWRPASEGSKDRMETVYEAEAEVIREAAKRVLAGDSLNSIVRDFHRRGLRGARGSRWCGSTLRQILMRPRISGRRLNSEGKIVKANWPEIVDIDTSDKLRNLLSGRSVKGRVPGQTPRPLVGLMFCGLCSGRMASRGGGILRCNHPDCGHVKITEARVNEVVEAGLLDWTDGGGIARLLAQSDAADAQDKLVELDRQDRELATRWAAKKLSDAAWDTARESLEAQRRPLQREVERQRRTIGLSDLPEPLRAAWPEMSDRHRRGVYRALIRRITIKPYEPRGGVRRFDPKRVVIDFIA